MFQPLIFEGKLLVLQSVIDPTCLVILDILEKKPEDFLECHLGWGHEKALASALFTALLGTSMGVTFLKFGAGSW